MTLTLTLTSKNNILGTKFCLLVALTSVGSVKLYVLIDEFVACVSGLGKEATYNMVWIVPGSVKEIIS